MEPVVERHEAGDLSASSSPPEVTTRPATRSWWRLALVAEFLLAMIATSIVWSEVGLQVHLDMMPWWVKLPALLAFSWCTVQFTMALADRPAALNTRSLRWLLAMLLIGGFMFAVTCYYHLHEPQDDTGDEEGPSTLLHAPSSTGRERDVA